MYKLLKIRGFVAMPIIIGAAILSVGVLGGLAYEYKNNQAVLFSVNKNNLLAQVSSGCLKEGVTSTNNLNCCSGLVSKKDIIECTTNAVNRDTLGYCYQYICIKTTTTTTCKDSDGGKNYTTRGTAIQSVSGQVTATSYDSCQGSLLNEAYCFSEGISLTEQVNCKAGYSCIDGACLATASASDIGCMIKITDVLSGNPVCTKCMEGNYLVDGKCVCTTNFVRQADGTCNASTFLICPEVSILAPKEGCAYTPKYNSAGCGVGYDEKCNIVCDTTSKAIVDSVGGCTKIDQSLYSNIYKA